MYSLHYLCGTGTCSAVQPLGNPNKYGKWFFTCVYTYTWRNLHFPPFQSTSVVSHVPASEVLCAPPPPLSPGSIWYLNYNIPTCHCKPLFQGLVFLVIASSVSTRGNSEHSRLYSVLLSRWHLLLPCQQYGTVVKAKPLFSGSSVKALFWYCACMSSPVYSWTTVKVFFMLPRNEQFLATYCYFAI